MNDSVFKWARKIVFNYPKYNSGRLRTLTLLKLALETVMNGKLELIQRNRCPYCGGFYAVKGSLVTHLRRGRCSERLGEDIYKSIELYNTLRSIMKKDESNIRVCLRPDDPRVKRLKKLCLHFRNKSEAMRFLLEALKTRQMVIQVALPKTVEDKIKQLGAS